MKNWKIFTLLLLVGLMSLSVSSCSKDDDDNQEIQSTEGLMSPQKNPQNGPYGEYIAYSYKLYTQTQFTGRLWIRNQGENVLNQQKELIFQTLDAEMYVVISLKGLAHKVYHMNRQPEGEAFEVPHEGLKIDDELIVATSEKMQYTAPQTDISINLWWYK